MKLSKTTVDIIKSFAAINPNLVIKPGKKFSTWTPVAKDILAEFEGDDEFEKQVSIYNANELLGVVAAFKEPELELNDTFMVISEGKQKVKYLYADDSVLSVPTKSVKFADPDVTFELSADILAKIQKMASILSVEDLSFIGNGKTVIARVHDVKNSSSNSFDLEIETTTKAKFNAHFKVEKINKLYGGDYTVDLSSKRISRFSHSGVKLVLYVAFEADSKFE